MPAATRAQNLGEPPCRRFIALGLRAGEGRADRKKHTTNTPESWGGPARGPNLLGEIHRAIPGCGSVSGLGEIGPNHECNGFRRRISKSGRGRGSPLRIAEPQHRD